MTINKRYRARSVSKVAGDTGAAAPLEDAKFNNICQFLGYGNPDTPVWFLGIEEGGGDVEQLRIRATWKPFVDCKDAHERLGITKFHCTENPAYQPTWNGMCWVMLGLGGNPNSTLEQRKTYQAEKLGRSGGCTFLTELYPLPKPNESAWPPDYANALRNRFQSLEDYRAQTVDVRVNLLRKAIEAHHPRVVIAYGKGCWKHYKRIVPGEGEWKPEGGCEVRTAKDTSFVLVPHFTKRGLKPMEFYPPLIDLVSRLLGSSRQIG